MKSLLVGTRHLPLQSVQLSWQSWLRLQGVWDPLLTRWYGLGLACMESYDLYNPFVDHTLRLIQHNWVVLAYNLNIVIFVLINGELSIGAISAYHFILVLSLLLHRIIILFLHLLSTNHKCTQPCYFPQLLRRRRWTRILQWGVLDYMLPRLPFLWCYGVFCYSVLLRVIIVFRDITYVIMVLYSWHLVICEPFWPYVWNNLS
jgi:hypothetical protein